MAPELGANTEEVLADLNYSWDDIAAMKRKAISFHWEFMFTRSLFQTEDMDEQHKVIDQVADC